MLYRKLKAEDGVVAQYAACHIVKWRYHYHEPTHLFREATPQEIAEEPPVAALMEACNALFEVVKSKHGVGPDLLRLVERSAFEGDDKERYDSRLDDAMTQMHRSLAALGAEVDDG